MGGPPPGPMPHNGPPGNYGGGPQRGGYHGGMGRDRQNGPPRFNDRGYQNDSGTDTKKNKLISKSVVGIMWAYFFVLGFASLFETI